MDKQITVSTWAVRRVFWAGFVLAYTLGAATTVVIQWIAG